MSDKKILTISIAAYNVEKYIRQALDSLLVPEILDDIEVFVIDDGGSDNTLSIAKEYENKYPNTFKAIHKENGGYGSTLNYSIKNALGKYFKVLDGDDWFDIKGFKSLVDYLKNSDADAVFTIFNKCYPNRIEQDGTFKNCKLSNLIAIEDFNIKNGIPMHAITYKTSILKESNLHLPEKIPYTDNYYVSIPFKLIQTVIIKDFMVYNYRLEREGQSVSKNTFIKNLDALYKISYDLVDFYEGLNRDNKAHKYLSYRVAATCADNYRTILQKPSNLETLQELKSFESSIKQKSPIIYKNMARLDRKMSFIIRLLRVTNYIFYKPLFAIINKTA